MCAAHFKLLCLCLCLCILLASCTGRHIKELQPYDKKADFDLDLTAVNWQLVTPLLLQRQQLRLCLAIYRYDWRALAGTPCAWLLARVPMAQCDIGQIEDISVTMRAAFGSMLLDTMQRCRPGLEMFGVRCRRRV